MALVIGKRRSACGLEDLHHKLRAGPGQSGNDGDDILCRHAGEGLRALFKFQNRIHLLAGRRGDCGGNPSGFLLPKFDEPAACLHHLRLIEGLFRGTFFMRTGNFAQHPKRGGEERSLADAEQKGVLGLIPTAEAILGDTVYVMRAWLEEE